jgi:Fanconi anemia group M protein
LEKDIHVQQLTISFLHLLLEQPKWISPCELIMAISKFRQAPPDSLHQGQYGEVECGFRGAITLCHILKLLHSHGIRPALEMLLTKLHQGHVYDPLLSNGFGAPIHTLL